MSQPAGVQVNAESVIEDMGLQLAEKAKQLAVARARMHWLEEQNAALRAQISNGE